MAILAVVVKEVNICCYNMIMQLRAMRIGILASCTNCVNFVSVLNSKVCKFVNCSTSTIIVCRVSSHLFPHLRVV